MRPISIGAALASSPRAFATSKAPPDSVRVALGAARNRPMLVKALDILRETLSSKSYDENVV